MNNLIKSVLCFDFKLELKDNENNLVLPGIKSTCFSYCERTPEIGTKMRNKNFFTNYDQALLDKIKDSRRLND